MVGGRGEVRKKTRRRVRVMKRIRMACLQREVLELRRMALYAMMSWSGVLSILSTKCPVLSTEDARIY